MIKSPLNKPQVYEENYQYLVKEHFFDTLREVFIVSTIIGFNNDIKIPFTKSGGDPIKEHLFSADDKNIMDCIALYSTQDTSILLNEKSKEEAKLIEEFAHGGIQYISEHLFNGKTVLTTDDIIDFVLQFDPSSVDKKKIDLTELLKNSLSDLD